jgi:PadR family transcriptional regulator AphA
LSSTPLNLFSYEILGLIGRNGASAHDLRAMVQRGRMLDWASESRYYTEPRRLADLGYLEARKEPGRTRERTVYTLTPKGLVALRAWAATPARFTPVKNELLVRVLVTDLVGEPATRASVIALRAEIADLETRLAEATTSADALPHRRKYLLLNLEFMKALLALHVDLVERIELEFDASAAGDEALPA